jgi:RNA polymerase sigma factor (sigma-70 family)
MMTTLTMSGTEQSALENDARLVAESLAGDRDAFGRIVARHQSLICSLAYSATGSLTRSEDLAQETFVTAWKQLPELREPAKLRPWLCGIARNLIGKTLRRDSREPAQGAGPLEEAAASASGEPLPAEQVMSREEEAILWRSLERIPETYREPLVLYYREGRSAERVAEELGLTEEAARQRLSRGRKLLQEQVMAFVEGALEQTTPGKAFTLGALAALPMMATSAKAAVVGATAAKGGALAKSAGLAGMCNAILGPVFVIAGIYFGYRMDRADATTARRRALTTKYYRFLVVCIVVFFVAIFSLTLGNGVLPRSSPRLYIELLLGVGVVYLMVIMASTVWMRRRLREIHRQEMDENPSAPLRAPLFEYRSKREWLGLPLVHIRFRGGLERGTVKAWIAAGDSALGALFAFGGVAIAPISFGGFSAGLLTMGGFAVGLGAFGGFALGPWVVGGMAVGWQAVGGCALAWLGAQGGAAAAHEFAMGGIALAPHANDAAAEAFFANSGYFQMVQEAMRYVGWVNVVWLFPLLAWWGHKKKTRQAAESGDR